ncbi:ankyrin repeat protein [Geopyxis carbonaria]|nr:ankyrin repeat protein [Geopyxis carbonaria]
MHAAASYNHTSLLKSLVKTWNGDPNITDNDGDTPLFTVETVEAARCLVEELGADPNHRNTAGLTVFSQAAEAIEEDGQFPLVVAYIRQNQLSPISDSNGTNSSNLPGPPRDVEVNLSTVWDTSGTVPPIDQELRRRIEELAERGDFESEETQRELRELVTGAVRDHLVDPEIERNVRQKGASG